MPMTRDMVLEARGLTKEVSSPEGALTIVRDVSLAVGRGESVAIAGPSGAGKSTLLALLAGLDSPTRGEVWLAGAPLSALDEDGRARLRAERVGFVFQSFHLVASLTALENVMLPLELAGRRDARTAATDMLARVGLAQRLHHYPRQLSGGEQQRVALARASVGRPQVLFADEPTGNLDTLTGERIAELLFDLNRGSDTTLVLVTHDRTLAARCRRVFNMDAGTLSEAASQPVSPPASPPAAAGVQPAPGAQRVAGEPRRA
jgi:putative ABC transport system ATP-binding protein